MKNIFIASLMTILAVPAFAGALKEPALKLIPEGTVVQEKTREVKVQTKAGSIVEVEFETNGEFEEASGNSLEKDIFNPGNGLISLSEATEILKKSAKKPSGDWNLEKTMMKGWIYEFEGFENGKEVDYIVDAKNGKLLETRVDD